jgi:hypothetical protein
MLRIYLSILLITVCFFSMGCNSRSTDTTTAWQRCEMYFALSRSDGGSIPEADWKDFVTNQVTPAFPGGFTELMAYGYYQQAGANKVEPVRVLVFLNPASKAESVNRKLDTLVKAYCTRFGQESVMRTDSVTNLFLHEK